MSNELNSPYQTTPALISRYFQNVEEVENAPLWLVTFTDVMALLLTFFVLLYAMSVPEVDKWNDMTKAVNKGLSRVETMESFSGQSMEISIDKISASSALDLNYLASLLEKQFDEYENMKSIVLLQSDDELVISMPADLLFKSGDAEISIEGKRAMYILGGILNKIRNRIEIIGHADPRLVSGTRFASNWELSLARATATASLLKEVGYQREMTVRGLSSSRYSEIGGNAKETIKMDTARRVDIIIMKDDGNLRSMLELDFSG
jgi:chemotaxis protein MotB